MKKALTYAVSAVFWLLVWQGVHLWIGKDILIPSPLSVLQKLLEFFGEWEFWLSVGTSLFRVISGLLLGTVLGIIIAVLTAKSSFIKTLFSPVLHTSLHR